MALPPGCISDVRLKTARAYDHCQTVRGGRRKGWCAEARRPRGSGVRSSWRRRGGSSTASGSSTRPSARSPPSPATPPAPSPTTSASKDDILRSALERADHDIQDRLEQTPDRRPPRDPPAPRPRPGPPARRAAGVRAHARRQLLGPRPQPAVAARAAAPRPRRLARGRPQGRRRGPGGRRPSTRPPAGRRHRRDRRVRRRPRPAGPRLPGADHRRRAPPTCSTPSCWRSAPTRHLVDLATTEVDAQRQDAVLERRLGVADDREVLEVELRLGEERLALLPATGGNGRASRRRPDRGSGPASGRRRARPCGRQYRRPVTSVAASTSAAPARCRQRPRRRLLRLDLDHRGRADGALRAGAGERRRARIGVAAGEARSPMTSSGPSAWTSAASPARARSAATTIDQAEGDEQRRRARAWSSRSSRGWAGQRGTAAEILPGSALVGRTRHRAPAADVVARERRAVPGTGRRARTSGDNVPVWLPPRRIIMGSRRRIVRCSAATSSAASDAAGRRGRAGPPQHLVDEHVAEAGDRALVEQDRLERRPPAAERGRRAAPGSASARPARGARGRDRAGPARAGAGRGTGPGRRRRARRPTGPRRSSSLTGCCRRAARCAAASSTSSRPVIPKWTPTTARRCAAGALAVPADALDAPARQHVVDARRDHERVGPPTAERCADERRGGPAGSSTSRTSGTAECGASPAGNTRSMPDWPGSSAPWSCARAALPRPPHRAALGRQGRHPLHHHRPADRPHGVSAGGTRCGWRSFPTATDRARGARCGTPIGRLADPGQGAAPRRKAASSTCFDRCPTIRWTTSSPCGSRRRAASCPRRRASSPRRRLAQPIRRRGSWRSGRRPGRG